MNVAEAVKMAKALMDEFGLVGWTLELDKAQKRRGQCVHSRKTLKMSEYFIMQNSPQRVELTVRHEIAHALVGPWVIRNGQHKKAGHGPEWKEMARKCGHTGNRCEPAVPFTLEDIRNGVTEMENDMPVAAEEGYSTLVKFRDIGDRITTGAKVTGTIQKIGRSRYHVLNENDGQIWTVPFNSRSIKDLERKDGTTFQPFAPSAQPMRGDDVEPTHVIFGTHDPRFDGKRGTIVKRGPKNSYVKVNGEPRHYVVPHFMVKPL